jgi:hypothetical protein
VRIDIDWIKLKSAAVDWPLGEIELLSINRLARLSWGSTRVRTGFYG